MNFIAGDARRSVHVALFALVATVLATGCQKGPAVGSVSGKVTYNGQPLPYGNVVFQPPSGQPAGGAIQPDGTFRLSTFSEYDGAIIGPHKVRVGCYTSQSPSQANKKSPGEASLGQLLIPTKYTFADQSGLTATVPAEGLSEVVFELTGPKRAFPK
jgi:hypothetical protein